MVLLKAIPVLVCITGLMSGCSPARTGDILLQIGPYQLTVAEYEYISNSASWKDLTVAQRQERLREEGRILAFAMDHRYDTISRLQRQLDYAMQYYASSVDGYLWNKKVKPQLQVPDEAVREAHALRTQEYKVETIYFNSEALLKKYYTAHQPVRSVHDFNALQQKVKAVPGTNIYSGYLRYPFYPLGVYLPALAQAKAGAVWGPVETLSGYYLVHLADKRPLAPVPLEQESPRIKEELMLALKEKIIWESRQKVLQDTRPVLHEEAIAAIAARVDVQKRQWPGVDQNLVLMEYDLEGTHHNYTVEHFTEFVQCQPVFTGSLTNPGDVKQMLHAWLTGIHLYAQAQQMNMENDKEYSQFRNRYQQQLFISHYKKQHMAQQPVQHYPVSIDHLEAYHRSRKNN